MNIIYLGIKLNLTICSQEILIKLTNFFNVIGFDINHQKIQNLKKGIDTNLELKRNELKRENILFTNDSKKITKSKIFIICVPTPIFRNNKPNLNPIITATKLVAQYLKKGDLVIYESTVFPGCTENICNPILEKISGLKMNRDYFLGYSPERVNPGDRIRSLDKISKVISASSKTGLNKVYNIYSKIIKAQIYKAQSIQVAEASKVIENVQRSVNISLINEISIILPNSKPSRILHGMPNGFELQLSKGSSQWL
jgi:UDP-N-acetyl-D-galactosamine dehydrogenase